MRLALVAHHLIVDMVSWFNLLEHSGQTAGRIWQAGIPLPASVVSFPPGLAALDWKMGDIGIDRLRAFWIV